MPETRVTLTDVEYDPPVDPLERQVAEIIAAVLDIDQVGRQDSFYDLGGGSMQAIRICSRIERETGHAVEPVWLLEHDVVVDFAEQIRSGGT